jgi:hypothetical protein
VPCSSVAWQNRKYAFSSMICLSDMAVAWVNIALYELDDVVDMIIVGVVMILFLLLNQRCMDLAADFSQLDPVVVAADL